MKTDSRLPADCDAATLLSGLDDFRELFDRATEGICLADIENGTIRDCNAAFVRLTGYERSELIGRPQAKLHPPEAGSTPVTRGFALHRSSRSGEVLHERLLTKTGEIRDVEIKAGPIVIGGRRLMHGFFRDVTDELRERREREMTLNLVRLLNDRHHTHELIRGLTDYLQKWTGCSAVGVRLREGDDFPYFETRGFSEQFVEAERHLCQRDLDGQIVRDGVGNPVLECMCGNVLCGRFDPKMPFFTARGSFWSNCTTHLLANTSEADRQVRTRNRCNGEGYESVALIALRHRDEVLGLLQLNDRAPGRFTPELIAFLESAADQIAIALAQRQAQTALEASEERYRRLFDVESDTVFLVDCESQRFIDANSAATKLYGYRRDEFLGMTVVDVSEEPEKTRQAFASGESEIRLRWHRKKDGTAFPVEIAGSYFECEGRKLHVAAIRDISARRQAEDALRESEKKYRSLFESSMDAVFLSIPDGRILAANRAARQMFGMTEEELRAAGREELLDASDPRYRAALDERRRTGRILSEMTGIRKDGAKFPVEVNSVILDDGARSFVIMRDITRRKQYESRLLEANERLELAKTAAGAGIWDVNLKTNRVEWSPEMYALLGLPTSSMEVSQEKFRSVIHPDDVDDVFRTLERDIRERDSHQAEFRIVKPDGEVRWMNGMASITRDGSDAVRVTGVCMDVTDRKRMEQSLRESEQRYRVLFEHMTEAFAHHRMIFEGGDPRDYVFLSVNKSFEAMTGLKNVTGKRVTEVLPGIRESDPQLFEVYGRVAATGQPEKYETYVDATTRWYQISVYSPKQGEFVTVFDDITARKRAEIALRASEERFRQMFDHMGSGMIVYEAVDDGEDFIIKEFNPAAERIGKISRGQVIGRRVSESFPGLKEIGLFQTFQRVWRTGVPEPHPTSFYHDDRFAVWVENYVVKLPTGEVVAIVDDITDRKNAEAELQRSREELAHASRLAAVGALTAGIAHEINQPLAVMATWVEVAAREIRDRLTGDKQEALLALMRIDAAMERSSRVIQHMKDFARKSEPRVAEVSILDAIDEVRELIEHQLRTSGVVLSVEFDASLPAAQADRTQVQQVLINLILNAVEALENVAPAARRILIRARASGGMLEVAVSDSGRSMTPEKIESVFEPFCSTKPSGLGLGLSICRTIVQWHGGRIWAACDAERGTTFTFTLPIAKENLHDASQTRHLHRGRRARSSRSHQSPRQAD